MNVRVIYHLLILDRDLQHIYVERCGTRWLVPLVTYVGPPCQQSDTLADALTRIGIVAWPVHDAVLAGAASTIRHGYCAYVVDAVDQERQENWLSLTEALRLVPRMDIQREALTTCASRFLHPTGPLDSLERICASETWAFEALAAHQEVVTGQARVLRHRRDRRITVWPTTSGDVYLKVSATGLAHEVTVTRTMASAVQGYFVSTIAADLVRGWWLYRGVAGVVLTPDRLTPELGERLGATFARIQRESMRSAEVEAAFNSSRIAVHDLMAVVILTQRLSLRFSTTEAELAELSQGPVWRAISKACRELDCLPSAFLHLDLWLPNIVDRQGSVAFLDMESSCWGPAVLPLWRLLNCLNTRSPKQVTASILASYVREWQNSRYRLSIEVGLDRLPVTGRLFELKRNLDRIGVRPSNYANWIETASPRRWLVNQLTSLLHAGRALCQ